MKACVLLALTLPGVSATAAQRQAVALPTLTRRHHPSEAAFQQRAPAATVAADADALKLPPVPAPVDTGADGYPQLPAVATMLHEAAQTMGSISTRTNDLAKRIAQAQADKAQKMQKQKAVFEKKLHTQEEENRAMLATNSKITAAINTLKSENAATVKHASELQAANKVMRTELATLQAKLGAAKAFTVAAMSATDDSRAPELGVLKAPAPAPRAAPASRAAPRGSPKSRRAPAMVALSKRGDSDVQESGGEEDRDDQADDADDGADDGTSFLAVGRNATRVTAAGADDAEDVLSILKRDVEALQKQERDSEANLKQRFLKDFQAGAKRHAVLVAHQRALNATRSGLTALQAKLRSAERHLEATHGHLEERMRGVGLFIQRLAHLALAPQTETPGLMKHLPASVKPEPAPAAVAAPASK